VREWEVTMMMMMQAMAVVEPKLEGFSEPLRLHCGVYRIKKRIVLRKERAQFRKVG
jgi:hypothetical protein